MVVLPVLFAGLHVVAIAAGSIDGLVAGENSEYAPDTTQRWECHHYRDGEGADWCAQVGFQEGYEFMYKPDISSPCSPCWCCQREAKRMTTTVSTPSLSTVAFPGGISAPAPFASTAAPLIAVTAVPVAVSIPAPLFPTAPPPVEMTAPPAVTAVLATTTTGPKKEAFTGLKHSVSIGGLSEVILAGSGGSVVGGSLVLDHNSGFSLFSKFEDNWEPDNLVQLKLLGKRISFTVDLSKVGCACNLAFYLISSPGRDWNGKPDPGSDRGGQPPYYCDANKVGGQWCPEVDIMEANDHAFQATPHRCDAPSNGHYSNCDRGGCEVNTRDKQGAYGPGNAYTIDTRKPFTVNTDFMEQSGTLKGMRTMLRQGEKQVVLAHTSCNADYFAALSEAMADGMSLRITYWGDKAETMSWMDAPPCGRQACSASAGQASISNMTIGPLPDVVEVVDTQTLPWMASTDAPLQEPEKKDSKVEHLMKHTLAVEGVSGAVLAGAGGSVEGGRLTLRHNSGFSLFSKFEDTWEPDNLVQLKLLGQRISFTVDLSKVGCACNLAFYLVSSPGRDWNGKPDPGSDRGGQPPYYCDANKVGGQWCPEVDIMEANDHAFQATPHRCEAPINGHYSSCDRGGCSSSTRDHDVAYGPGQDYTIDTTKPFTVDTDFTEEMGTLAGMRTSLRQGEKQVLLAHSSCNVDYFLALSDAMADGMSLRITYWGDKAETMAWMDAPPCGRQTCGETAGDAVIANISVGAIPETVWVVSDTEDRLDGRILPEKIVKDSGRFVRLGRRGVADWKDSTHYVVRQEGADSTLPSLRDCDDDAVGSSPCEISLKRESAFLNNYGVKYSGLHRPIAPARASAGFGAFAVLALAASAMLLVAVLAIAARFVHQLHRRAEVSNSIASAAAAEASKADVVASIASRRNCSMRDLAMHGSGGNDAQQGVAPLSTLARASPSSQQLLQAAAFDQ